MVPPIGLALARKIIRLMSPEKAVHNIFHLAINFMPACWYNLTL